MQVYLDDFPRAKPAVWPTQAASQRQAYAHLCTKLAARLVVSNPSADPLQSGDRVR